MFAIFLLTDYSGHFLTSLDTVHDRDCAHRVRDVVMVSESGKFLCCSSSQICIQHSKLAFFFSYITGFTFHKILLKKKLHVFLFKSFPGEKTQRFPQGVEP